jgi:hypothetical protein
MQYTRGLLYHPIRREAITQINPHLIVKWDIANQPRMLTKLHLSKSEQQYWREIPVVVLFPDLERIGVIHTDAERNVLMIYHWDDLRLIETIEIPPVATDEPEVFSSHPHQPAELTEMNITVCGTYLYIVDDNGGIALYHLAQQSWSYLTASYFEYHKTVIFDRDLKLLMVECMDMDASYDVYRIEDIHNNRLTHIGQRWEVIGSHRGELQLNPFTNAIVWTGHHCRIKYYTFSYDRLSAAPETDYGMSSTDNILEEQWCVDLPYIHYPYTIHSIWRSCVAFQTADILLFGAGKAIVQIRVSDGALLSEYQTESIVHEIVYDAEDDRVIAITNDDLIVVSIANFSPDLPYFKMLRSIS